jgi:hypothetical protein
VTWLERMDADPSLRQFVEAEIARAGVECHSLRVQVEQLKAANAAAEQKIRYFQKRSAKG